MKYSSLMMSTLRSYSRNITSSVFPLKLLTLYSILLLLSLMLFISAANEKSLSNDIFYFKISSSNIILLLKSLLLLLSSSTFSSSTLAIACNYIMKVVPKPIPSLLTLTSPPIFSMRCLQMLKPRPVPCLFTPSSSASLLKLRNNLEMFSSLMPLPESCILISNDT